MRNSRANLGRFIDNDGHTVRVWFKDGEIRFRRLHARQDSALTLDFAYAVSKPISKPSTATEDINQLPLFQ
jgi:hypothetical protein